MLKLEWQLADGSWEGNAEIKDGEWVRQADHFHPDMLLMKPKKKKKGNGFQEHCETYCLDFGYYRTPADAENMIMRMSKRFGERLPPYRLTPT